MKPVTVADLNETDWPFRYPITLSDLRAGDHVLIKRITMGPAEAVWATLEATPRVNEFEFTDLAFNGTVGSFMPLAAFVLKAERDYTPGDWAES